jgi:hypothetical protein
MVLPRIISAAEKPAGRLRPASEHRERTAASQQRHVATRLNSPIEKAMLALQTMSDEMEREKARQRTYDAMRRKFEQRHVTGGQCFGYRNVDVTAAGPDGRPKRQYVRREIQPDEAAIVRRIFELCAAGEGLKTITKRLNGARSSGNYSTCAFASRTSRRRLRAAAPCRHCSKASNGPTPNGGCSNPISERSIVNVRARSRSIRGRSEPSCANTSNSGRR